MNNFPRAAAKLLDDERQLTPQVILNADVTDGGVVVCRGGYRLTADLADCHSLWAGSVMLCVAQGAASPQALCQVEGAVSEELCEIPGLRAQVSYDEINGLIYASNPYWPGAIFDPLNDTVRSWGVPLAPAPDLSLVEGDLPPGAYTLAYTNVVGGQLGGNGPLVQVAWEGMPRGIQLNNLPAGALCWITHPNGGNLFRAPVSGGVISVIAPEMQPLPTFMVQPPPGFSHFVFAHGRVWGARARKVWYSDPHQYEWFRPRNYLPFLEEMVLLAPVTGGLFANSLKSTWFLEGTDPAKMSLQRVGDGAVPGTLIMAQVEGGGYEISRKLAQLPSPVWMSRGGIVVGTHSGHLVHLTEGKVRLQARPRGAGLYRLQEGIPQIIVSTHGDGGGNDDDLLRLFEEGKIFN